MNMYGCFFCISTLATHYGSLLGGKRRIEIEYCKCSLNGHLGLEVLIVKHRTKIVLCLITITWLVR